jgi:hypothetical protein
LAEAAAPLGSEAADLSDLADLSVEAQLLVLAHVVVVVLPLDPAELADLVVEAARLPALAYVVVEAAQLLQLLRSPQSFSASTARISPSPVQPTYERAPSTR